MNERKLGDWFKKALSECQTVEDLAALIGQVHWFGIKDSFTARADEESERIKP